MFIVFTGVIVPAVPSSVNTVHQRAPGAPEGTVIEPVELEARTVKLSAAHLQRYREVCAVPASVQGLPPDEFGSGSAVSQAVRNLGATLGVALVIALTAGATPDTALDHFHSVWWLLAASGAIVSLVSMTLPKRRPAPAVVPAEAVVAPA